MKNKVFVLFLSMFVGGCAAFGITSENPELMQAVESAKTALEKARSAGAMETHSDNFEMVLERFEDVEEKREKSPALTLIEEYNKIEKGAYETAINSLQKQLDQQQSKFKDLKGKLDNLRKKLEERVTSLEQRAGNLENDKQSLKRSNRELKQKMESLTQRKNELQDKVENTDQLRSRISELRTRQKALKEELQRVRDEKVILEAKLDNAGDTIDNLNQKLQQRSQNLKTLKQENKKIKGELDNRLSEGDVRTKDRSVYIALESRLLFGLGNVHVQDEIKDDLDVIADSLEEYSDRDILVEGHTDDLPLQNELKEKYGSNWELSAHRAINVLKYLVYARDIDSERIGAVAYGKFRPRVPNTSTDNRAKNRRVEIVLLPPDLPVKKRNLNS